MTENYRTFTNVAYTNNICRQVVSATQCTVMLDCGPAISNSEAWIFKEIISDSTVFGFEPHPRRYTELCENDYPGILYQSATASRSGRAIAFTEASGQSHLDNEKYDQIYLDENWGNVKEGATKKETIELISIDDFIAKHKIEDNIFLWMDIEGSEYETIRGALSTLCLGQIKVISAEINLTISSPSYSEIFNTLLTLNYVPIMCSSPCALPVEICKDIQILGGYMLYESDNPHADFCFVHSPPLAKMIPRNFFKVIKRSDL